MNKLIKYFAEQIVDALIQPKILEKIQLEIFRVVKIDVGPGDVIVLKSKFQLSQKYYDHIMDVAKENFPDHKVVILEEGMDIQVVSKGEHKD